MILVDNRGSHDPRINLALEEFIVRNRDQGDYLLLYVNDPVVVIGKHQNPLDEVNFRYAREEGIPVLRRISGGGAVYHDRGNLNFSCITSHTPERHNNYAPFVAPVLSLLESFGVEAKLNNRNSLVLNDGRKFSGNAQFASRGRMLSHGTLLFESDLDRLTRVLDPDIQTEESRGVPSIRSRVVNLDAVLPSTITLDSLTASLLEAFAGENPVVEDLTREEWREVEELARSKYDSWEWNTGRTPRFLVHHNLGDAGRLKVKVKDGLIIEVDVEKGNASLRSWARDLPGRRYSHDFFAEELRKIEEEITPQPGERE